MACESLLFALKSLTRQAQPGKCNRKSATGMTGAESRFMQLPKNQQRAGTMIERTKAEENAFKELEGGKK